MLKKITLAAALVLSVAGTAYAASNGDSLHDRQNASACERPAAPNICK